MEIVPGAWSAGEIEYRLGELARVENHIACVHPMESLALAPTLQQPEGSFLCETRAFDDRVNGSVAVEIARTDRRVDLIHDRPFENLDTHRDSRLDPLRARSTDDDVRDLVPGLGNRDRRSG